MKTKTLVAAFCSFALVVSPLFVSLSYPTTVHAAVSNWQKGVSILPLSTTDLASDQTKQSLQKLKATGANYVAFVVPYYQSNTGSTDIAPGWNTPTDATLGSAIDYAHSIGLGVALKIHIESNDGAWRAYINPGDRVTWFNNFGNYAAHLGALGKQHSVELINLGTEMVSMTANSINGSNTQNWINVIGRVRAVFSGKLTYDANNNNNTNDPFVNEKKYIGFWQSLDYVGLSSYYQLNGSSVQDFKNSWDYWNKNDIQPFEQQTGKPIMLTEVGYRSVDNAHNEPWNSGSGGGYNPQEQANLYEALLSYWNDYPYMQGVYWWDWKEDPNAGGQGNTDYTPQNKPAQQTITKWFTTAGSPTSTPPIVVAPTPTSTPTTTPPVQNGPNNPATAGAFISSGSANPGGTNVGSTVTLLATVTPQASQTASHVTVDIEVYDRRGKQVYQNFYSDLQFAAGESRDFQAQWAPSAAGTYAMTIGVFSNDWSKNYHWNDAGATIKVGTGSPVTTPPPTTNPTSTPPTNGTAPNASIDNASVTVGKGGIVDFVGRNWGHEEDVSIAGAGVSRNAHADGGGNFSTGSIQVSSTAGQYICTFTGKNSGTVRNATVTVTQ